MATHSCWDGSNAATTSACTAPSGHRGLQYLFPSFVQADLEHQCEFRAGEIDAPPFRGMLDSWRCRVPVAQGGRAWLNYGWWRSWNLDVQHYRGKYAATGVPEGQFLAFPPARVGMTKTSDGVAWQTARVFRDRKYPYSVSAIADTRQALQEALAQLHVRRVTRVDR